MASRWRHCADLTGSRIKFQTSCTDSVRLATEPTGRFFLIHTFNLKYNLANLFFNDYDLNTIRGLNLEFANFSVNRAPRVLISFQTASPTIKLWKPLL